MRVQPHGKALYLNSAFACPGSPKDASETREIAQTLKRLPPHYSILADMFGAALVPQALHYTLDTFMWAVMWTDNA